MPRFTDAELRAMLLDSAVFTLKGLPHPSSASSAIKCNLREEFEEILDMESMRIVVDCVGSDIDGVSHNADITITKKGETTSTIYTIKGVEPNGNGLTTLKLEEQ